MTESRLRNDRAARCLNAFAQQYAGTTRPADDLIALLTEVDHLAALDLADCQTDNQKQRVYAIIAAALMHALQVSGSAGEASRSLYDALVNLALGVPKDHRLKKWAVPSQLPIGEDAIRAAIIVACERYPDQKEQIVQRGALALSYPRATIWKMLEHFKGGRLKSQALRGNVEYYRQAADAGENWFFDGLV